MFFGEFGSRTLGYVKAAEIYWKTHFLEVCLPFARASVTPPMGSPGTPTRRQREPKVSHRERRATRGQLRQAKVTVYMIDSQPSAGPLSPWYGLAAL